jgi:SAM-dependent methyltransferase
VASLPTIDAARKARRFSDEIHTGDVLMAPFANGSFDVVSMFHVLEHVPDPVAVVRRTIGWLAPGGLPIIEVPNAGGFGASVFGRAWSGLDLPRHLSHFTPDTLAKVVERTGGRIAWCWHTRPSPATTSGAWATGSAIANAIPWRDARNGARPTVC